MADSVAQYLKNTEQFGILLVILLTMGVVAQEKERGTAAMLLTKPVSRSAVILAKWLTGMTILLAGLLVDGLACLAYTAVLFEPLPFGTFWVMNLLLLVYAGGLSDRGVDGEYPGPVPGHGRGRSLRRTDCIAHPWFNPARERITCQANWQIGAVRWFERRCDCLAGAGCVCRNYSTGTVHRLLAL